MNKERKRHTRAPRHGSKPRRRGTRWQINWNDEIGNRHFRSFVTYEEAAQELVRRKGEVLSIKEGRAPRMVDVPTFADFIEERYRPARTSQKRSPKDDESIFRVHLIPAFGTLPLTAITTARVEDFKSRLLQAGRSAHTIANILGLLSAILRYAMDLEILYRLPKIKRPRIYQKEPACLKNSGDVKKFLQVAGDVGGAFPYVLFATAIYTGLRAGELFGLEWSDVDFSRRLITVRRSWNKETTKSGKTRHVPILNVLRAILAEWKLESEGRWVFPTSTGTQHTPTPRVTKGVLQETLKVAGLPRMRFHDLRHSFASQWVANGGDLFKLQKILGHADQQMVMRYAHLAPDAFRDDLNIFGSKPPAVEAGEVVKLKRSNAEGSE
jgi:integrase